MNNDNLKSIMYNYSVHGLNISSELKCPDLNAANGTSNVFIKFGLVPNSLPEPKLKHKFFESNDKEFLFRAEGVAYYYVTGNQITIQKMSSVEDKLIRVYLSGSVMSAFLMLNGYLPLHASSIEVNGKAVLFVGDTGAGKSTLSSAFLRKGYKIISDDVNVIRFSEDKAYTSVGIIHSKLWPDTVELFGENVESLEKVRHDHDKYRIYNKNDHKDISYPIYKIYLIEKTNINRLQFLLLNGKESFTEIFDKTYRKLFLYGKDSHAKHLANCAELANKINITKIIRPADKFTLDEIINFIEDDISELVK